MTLALTGARTVPWNDTLPSGLTAEVIVFGRDETSVGEVQVAVATAAARPTKGMLDAAWRTRGTNTAMPVLVAAVHAEGVWYYDSREAPLGPVPLGQAERQLQSILDERDAIAAQQQIRSIQRAYNATGAGGFANHFLFASYHLRTNLRRRPDWANAQELAAPMLAQRGRDLIAALGFTAEPASGAYGSTLVLRARSGSRRAIAVLLDESEQFDQKSAAYQLSPVAHGLELAGREDVPWLIVLRRSTLRLYPGRDGVGVGQRGQSETFFELDLAFLDPDYTGLLPLIFSADALERGGSTDQILDASGRYAADLGSRLRDRVYLGVVPSVAIAIAERLPQLGLSLDARGLDVAYSLTLRILFRLLFQAYAEDSGLLPAGRNDHYDANSLQAFIKREAGTPCEEFSRSAASIWLDLVQVWDAIYNGNPRWDVPAYGGSLFDPTSQEGLLLRKLELPDSVLGPALQAMLTEVTEDGVRGPVDFRSLQVREFGTIYEGLLESSLSFAATDLTLDAAGTYVPAADGDDLVVAAGTPYFHSASGERKATGSYYTPKVVVDHLIARSVAPALEAHLERVRDLVEAGRDREAAATFWDFRVADPAMGSAHFLVAAVDKIERGMRDFLTVTPVPAVRAELQRLADKARESLRDDVEAADAITEAQLLRRQVARRCVYGLDINPLAVELARLAVWIHTFVPGLPMSSLDHGLVLGNSLTGIGTVDEALEALAVGELFQPLIREPLESARHLLIDFANASEADKSEVLKGAEMLREAEAAAAPAKAIFDVAVAMRLRVVQPGTAFAQADIDAIARAPRVVEALEPLTAAHMPYLFPEVFLRDRPGFDVVIGNPPWEEVMVEEPKFWLRVRPGLLGLAPAALKAEIARLRVDRADLLPDLEREKAAVAALRKVLLAGPYPGLGTGDIDLYQAFAWRFWHLLRSGSSMAFVTPRSLLSSAGGSGWRREVFTNGATETVTLLNNRQWVFPIHPQYTIALTVIRKAAAGMISVAGPFASERELLDGGSAFGSITVDELEAGSMNLSVPQLPGPLAVKAFRRLRAAPRLDERRPGWDFRPVSEFHATNDRPTFDAGGPAAGRLPVRGGAGFELWNPETSEVYAWADRTKVEAALLAKRQRQIGLKSSAFYGMAPAWADDPNTLPLHHPRVAFRDVARATDTRTSIAALIPPGTALINSAPYVFRYDGEARAEAYLLAVLCSIPLDWYARKYVEIHLNLHIFNSLPIPEYRPGEALADRLVTIAGRLAARDERYLDWAMEVGVEVGTANEDSVRSDLLAELDAVVALLYGLTEEQVEQVFATFHRGWDYRPRLDSVLAHYTAWKGNA